MENEEKSLIVEQIYGKAMELLSPQEVAAIQRHPDDPALVTRRFAEFVRLRASLVNPGPRGLWGWESCFFQVEVGWYRPEPGDLIHFGGIRWTAFPNHSSCSDGQVRRRLEEVLREVAGQRSDFVLLRPEHPRSAKASCTVLRRFLAEGDAGVPRAEAARDLAWLVRTCARLLSGG